MGDDIRSVLMRTDMSADAIQHSAGVMMRHYDKSPSVAVTEWRNTLQNANSQQFLPLLYVANEVLQTSKRNRGTKFLEAFSPVLGQSLQYICQCDPSLTEKVRRTTKIWGDRRVFSVRFVNDLLEGLEPYRHGNVPPPKKEPMAAPFSPVRGEREEEEQEQQQQQEDNTTEESQPDDDERVSIENIMANTNNASFGFAEDGMHLDLDLKIDSAVLERKQNKQRAGGSSSRPNSKRGRDDSTMNSTSARSKAQRRRSVLSTTSLMELWNQIASLQQSFEQTRTVLSSTVTPEHLDTDGASAQDLVGDELLANFKDCLKAQSTLQSERRVLHRIANERHMLENECMRYIPWLRLSRKQDDEEVKLCYDLEEKLSHLKMVHAKAKAARDLRRERQAAQKKKAEKEKKIRKEEEERRRLIKEATKKETEARPGMVWNRATGEYQYLNTDESWRD